MVRKRKIHLFDCSFVFIFIFIFIFCVYKHDTPMLDKSVGVNNKKGVVFIYVMLNWGRFFVLFFCEVYSARKNIIYETVINWGKCCLFYYFFWWIGGNHFIRGENLLCILRNVFHLKGRWVNGFLFEMKSSS